MRLRVVLEIPKAVAIPINHQHLMTGAVYRFLERADAGYARFLHDEGYSDEEGEPAGRRRFKLFTFSPLRAPQRRVQGAVLWLGPGIAEWLVASPVHKFLMEFASGLLAEPLLQVGAQSFPVVLAETLPAPLFSERQAFTCLSPVVVAVADERDGRRSTRYLRPGDPEFGERARQNLLRKHRALHGSLPADPSLSLAFDAHYLAQRRGTKLIDFKGIRIVGAFCPFTLTGSPDLMALAYDCGLGEKNSSGFGMIAIDGRSH